MQEGCVHMDNNTYAMRDRARRRADREVIPAYLKDTFADIKYWQEKLRFYEYQAEITDADAAQRPTIDRKIIEITEILNVFYQDARQLNRKLR